MVRQFKTNALCLISFAQLLHLFFKGKDATKNLKRAWFDLSNG